MAEELIRQVCSSIEERNEVIRSLYTDAAMKKAVVGTLVKMGCDEAQAKDHFTDAIVSFIKSCYKKDFEIKHSLTNYLIGTARNIWLKGVTKSTKERTTNVTDNEPTETVFEDNLIKAERRQLLSQLINKLDTTCQKVITMWSFNKRMREIATVMEYKSEGMARKKKHQCIQRLYAIIEKYPHIKRELKELI